jgi:hypothetical protein
LTFLRPRIVRNAVSSAMRNLVVCPYHEAGSRFIGIGFGGSRPRLKSGHRRPSTRQQIWPPSNHSGIPGSDGGWHIRFQDDRGSMRLPPREWTRGHREPKGSYRFGCLWQAYNCMIWHTRKFAGAYQAGHAVNARRISSGSRWSASSVRHLCLRPDVSLCFRAELSRPPGISQDLSEDGMFPWSKHREIISE